MYMRLNFIWPTQISVVVRSDMPCLMCLEKNKYLGMFVGKSEI